MPPFISRYLVAALAIGGSLSLTMCGGGESGTGTSSSCPNGICGSSSSSSGNTGGGGSASSSSSSGGMSSSSSSSSGGPCTEAWVCSAWDTGGNGDSATRACTDTNNCGTTTGKPPTTATLPALDDNYFRCNVEPILDKKCSMLGCHGTETGRALRVYARARLRNAPDMFSSSNCAGTLSGASCTGSNSCPCEAGHSPTEWQRNYDSARGFGLDANGNPLADQSQSDLIAQPVVGGKAHAGIHLFRTTDPEYSTLLNWLNGATLATCDVGIN